MAGVEGASGCMQLIAAGVTAFLGTYYYSAGDNNNECGSYVALCDCSLITRSV